MSSAGPQNDTVNMFKFSSVDGRDLLRKILKSKIPYEPHDYQIEGVCKSLDGTSLLAVIPTGGGKTAYFLMYMLALQALSQDPTLCPHYYAPKDPILMISYPLIGLEEEMVCCRILPHFLGLISFIPIARQHFTANSAFLQSL